MINNNRKGEAKFSKCLKRKRKKMKIANWVICICKFSNYTCKEREKKKEEHNQVIFTWKFSIYFT